MGFLRYLWSLGRFIPPPPGLRPGGGGARFFGFLFLAFCVALGIAALLGFDVSRFPDWLDAHAVFWGQVGDVAFKILLGFILCLCALVLVAQVANPKEDRPGWGTVIFALIVGYACAVGLFTGI